MEDPQQRRRRPTTYGKSARKRFSSDIDSVFSSPANLSSPGEPSESITPAPPAKKSASASAQQLLPPQPEASLTNTNRRDKRDKDRAAPEPTRKSRLVSKAPPKPGPLGATTYDTSISISTTDDDSDSPSAQLQLEAAMAVRSDNHRSHDHLGGVAIYDLPSSDEDDHRPPRQLPSRKRKVASKAPLAPQKAAKARVISEDNAAKKGTQESVMVSARRQWAATKATPQVSITKKLTQTAKVTKPSADASATRKSQAKAQPILSALPAPVSIRAGGCISSQKSPAEEPEDISRNTRVTRSQSRQPSAPPPQEAYSARRLMEKNDSPNVTRSDPRTVSPTMAKPSTNRRRMKAGDASIMPVVGQTAAAEPTRHEPRKSQPRKPPDTARRDKNARTTKPQGNEKASRNPTKSTSKQHPLQLTKQTSMPTVVEKQPIKPARSLSAFDFFPEGDIVQKTPNRKRLIDSLGVGPGYPNKKSCTSSDDDDNDRDCGYSLENFFKDDSQNSQAMPDFRMDFDLEESSQQVTTSAVERPVFGNNRGGGPRITYARERSFRAEDSLDEMALLNMPLAMPPFEPGGRRRLIVDPTVNHDEKQRDKGTGMMKSIHALRAAGEKNRFIDDVEELFGDIEGNVPLSRKRAGYMVMASKMCEKSFLRNFRANSFEHRLFKLLRDQTDEIVIFAFAFIIYCFINEDSTPRTIIHLRDTDIVPMLVRMLEAEKDIVAIAKDRKSNMSKVAQEQVRETRTLVEKSAAFARMSFMVISPQLLALKILEMMMARYRECGVLDEILPIEGVKQVIGIMKPIAAAKEKPPDTKLPLLALSVSTLESYVSGNCTPLRSELSKSESDVLANIFPSIYSWTVETLEATDPILSLLLRMVLNITNNRPDVSDTYATPRLVSTLICVIGEKFRILSRDLTEEQRGAHLDLLILSLGLMINFAEVSAKARAVADARDFESDRRTGVDVLLDAFLNKLERAAEAESMEETQTLVAFGYLAVLLGNLCQDDHTRYKVRARLPKSSLLPLVGAIEQFVTYHRKVDMMSAVQDEDVQATFTKRLGAVIHRLKRAEGLC